MENVLQTSHPESMRMSRRRHIYNDKPAHTGAFRQLACAYPPPRGPVGLRWPRTIRFGHALGAVGLHLPRYDPLALGLGPDRRRRPLCSGVGLGVRGPRRSGLRETGGAAGAGRAAAAFGIRRTSRPPRRRGWRGQSGSPGETDEGKERQMLGSRTGEISAGLRGLDAKYGCMMHE